MPKSAAEMFQEARKARGWSLGRTAKECGLPYGFVQHLASGERPRRIRGGLDTAETDPRYHRISVVMGIDRTTFIRAVEQAQISTGKKNDPLRFLDSPVLVDGLCEFTRDLGTDAVYFQQSLRWLIEACLRERNDLLDQLYTLLDSEYTEWEVDELHPHRFGEERIVTYPCGCQMVSEEETGSSQVCSPELDTIVFRNRERLRAFGHRIFRATTELDRRFRFQIQETLIILAAYKIDDWKKVWEVCSRIGMKK